MISSMTDREMIFVYGLSKEELSILQSFLIRKCWTINRLKR